MSRNEKTRPRHSPARLRERVENVIEMKTNRSVRSGQPKVSTKTRRDVRASNSERGSGQRLARVRAVPPCYRSVNNFRTPLLNAEQLSGYLSERKERFEENERLNALLVESLENHPHGKRMASMVKSCSVRVLVQNGEAERRCFSCNVRFCARCFKRTQAERREVLERVFKRVYEETNALTYSWVTLTMRPTKKNNLRHRITLLRKTLTQFLHSKEMRNVLDSVYYRLEVTRNFKTGHWNTHAHLCVMSSVQRNELESHIKAHWKLGDVIDVKRWRVEEHSEVALEFCKGQLCSYLTKPFSDKLRPEDLAEAVLAFKGVRTCGAWGLMRLFVKEVKEDIEEEKKNAIEERSEGEEADLEPPPESFSKLPDGLYTLGDLFGFIMEGGRYVQFALYCLRVLKWDPGKALRGQ